MSHLEAKSFFRQQNQRMDTSDDDIQEYHTRMMADKRRSDSNSTVDNDQVAGIHDSKKAGTTQRASGHTHDRTRSSDLHESPSRRISPRKRKHSDTTNPSGTKRGKHEGIHNSRSPPSPLRPGSREITPSNRKLRTSREPEDWPSSQRKPAKYPAPNSSPRHINDKSANLVLLKEHQIQANVPDISNEQVISAVAYDDGHLAGTSPSSPIEDASDFLLASPSGPVIASPSRLLESIRKAAQDHFAERSSADAGQHSAKKRRPKVRKLDTTPSHRDSGQSSVIWVSSSPSPEPTRITPAPSRNGKAIMTSKANTRGQAASGKKQVILNSKGKKPFPDEYARMLQQRAEELRAKAPNEGQFLRGMKIFYYGGDRTVATTPTIGKMEKIVRYGADIVDKYDPSAITQIIVDKDIGTIPFLRTLGLRKLADIPNHIPTLDWEWVQDAITKYLNYRQIRKNNPIPNFEITMGHYWDYARFSERIDAGGDVNDFLNRVRAKQDHSVADFSHISDFSTDDVKTVQRSEHRAEGHEYDEEKHHIAAIPQRQKSNLQAASSSRVPLDLRPQQLQAKLVKEDPLEEFYAQAMSEFHERDGQRYGEVDGTDEEFDNSHPDVHTVQVTDGTESRLGACPNQDVVDKLEELMELHRAKPSPEDKWRVYSYTKSIRSLRNHPKRIRSLEDALALPGVGKKTAEKIMEIIRTGELRRIKWENTDDVAVLKLFRGIYGVGNKIGMQWYNAGARTLEDLKAGKFGIKLSPAQQLGIRYYYDINSRMPRSEARRIFELIKPIALAIDPKLLLQLVGSYRRGKADCGDIDIIITRNDSDGKTHEGILRRLLRKLHAADILTEDLTPPENFNKLETTYRGLCHLPGVPGARRRRIDFLTTTWKSRGAALIYYTGDDIFNRSIRLKAHKMGYALDQHGLWDGVIRNPRKPKEKFQKGNIIASETEEDIFRVLEIPWQEPHERVRNLNSDIEPVIASRLVEPIEVVDDENDSDYD